MNIKIYGADWCPDCVTAKKFLNSKEVKFEYIIITDNSILIHITIISNYYYHLL